MGSVHVPIVHGATCTRLASYCSIAMAIRLNHSYLHGFRRVQALRNTCMVAIGCTLGLFMVSATLQGCGVTTTSTTSTSTTMTTSTSTRTSSTSTTTTTLSP